MIDDPMPKTPEDCVEQVVDLKTFLIFLQALADDWEEEKRIEKSRPSEPYGAGALGWQNGTIGTFLDAAVGWGEVGAASWSEELAHNPWRLAAQIMLMGKHYE